MHKPEELFLVCLLSRDKRERETILVRVFVTSDNHQGWMDLICLACQKYFSFGGCGGKGPTGVTNACPFAPAHHASHETIITGLAIVVFDNLSETNHNPKKKNNDTLLSLVERRPRTNNNKSRTYPRASKQGLCRRTGNT